jgi:hypothetical protein
MLSTGVVPASGYQDIYDPIKVHEEATKSSPLLDTGNFMEQTKMDPQLMQVLAQKAQSSEVTPSYYNYGKAASSGLSLLGASPFMQTSATLPDVSSIAKFAAGGSIMPSPLMAAAGGVPHKGSHYVQGAGGGQDDLIDARLADGEYVFDADIVSALGDGSNKEGAKKLDAMREAIRKHKRSAPNDKIPPKAKSPLSYLKGTK